MESKGKILVVDDDARVSFIVSEFLKEEGWQVEVVDNLSSAQEVIERSAGQFALVLTDLDLPRGSGREVIICAKHHNPELPVIVMSGSFFEGDEIRPRLKEIGAVATVPKPFDFDELVALVRLHARAMQWQK